jgi:hypothetical protein
MKQKKNQTICIFGCMDFQESFMLYSLEYLKLIDAIQLPTLCNSKVSFLLLSVFTWKFPL